MPPLPRRRCPCPERRGRPRLPSFLPLALVLGAVWGAWPGACRAQDAPAADRLRLLELRLDRLPAGETLACYASGDALLVPLAALARPLGLAIEVDATGTRARGCVIRPERGLEVDAARGTAVVDGHASRFAPARAETHDGDLCVDARLLAEWLPLDIAADSLAGTLEVTSREVLPVTARRLRAQRAALLRVPAMRDHPAYPRVAPSYGWLSVPFVDQDVRALAQRGPLGTAGALELRTHAAGDVLGCEGHLFASTLAGAGGGPVRATLGRKDEEGRLLGPLRATQFAVGEVLDAGLSDLTAARAGTGLTLGNAPLTQASEFDRHRFAGLLEPGWEVELYRNGALLAYQGADVAETYEFDDVALDYGVNEFKLRFYGPQGQERVERQVYAADADMARSGALTYRLTAAALHDGTPRAALGLDWGLARRVAMGLRLATARLEGVEHRYAEASLRAVQGRVVYQLAGLGDARGGSGARASAHARWTALGVDLDHFESRRLATETSDLGPGGRQGRTTLRVYSRVRVPFMAGAPLSLEARPERLRGDRSQDQVITRATLAGRWLSLAHEHRAVAMRARGPALASASATDRLVASGRLRALTVRGRVEYDPRSPVRVRTSSLVLERHRASGGFAELGLERRSAVDETHLLAGLAAPLRVCALKARLGFGLGYEPRSRRLVASPQRLADQGALSVHAFVDANGNGVADPGEAP